MRLKKQTILHKEKTNDIKCGSDEKDIVEEGH